MAATINLQQGVLFRVRLKILYVQTAMSDGPHSPHYLLEYDIWTVSLEYYSNFWLLVIGAAIIEKKIKYEM